MDVNGKGNVNENVNTSGNVKWECGWELEYGYVNVIANAKLGTGMLLSIKL